MENHVIFLVTLGVIYIVSGAVAILSYFVAAPLLIAEHKILSLKEQYLNFGNLTYIYSNIRSLRARGVQKAGIVLLFIKYNILICITSFLIFAISAIIIGRAG